MATIVVLEDDEIIRDLIVRILERHGYTVLPFIDARPALDGVDFDAVDLVITDLSMRTPGDVAVQELRARGIVIPVIVVSGHVPEDTAQYLVSLGIHTILRKPFKLLELLNIVRSLV